MGISLINRLRLAWEAFTTGGLSHLDFMIERQAKRIKLLESYLYPSAKPAEKPVGPSDPEVLDFPHRGKTRTPFD